MEFPVDVVVFETFVLVKVVVGVVRDGVVLAARVLLSLMDMAAIEAVAAAATEAKLVGLGLLLSDCEFVEAEALVEEVGDDLIIGLAALRGIPLRKGLPAAGASVGFLLPSLAAVLLESGVDDIALVVMDGRCSGR